MQEIEEQKLERLRKTARRRYRLCGALTIAAFFALLPVLKPFADAQAQEIIPGAPAPAAWLITLLAAAVLSAGVLALLYLLFANRPYQHFNDLFKQQYVLQTIQSIDGFSQLVYDPKRGFTHDEVRNAAVVNCGDKKLFESEDLLTGVYRDVGFRFSDVATKREVRKARGRREITPIFSGQVIEFARFDSRKRSDGHLQVFQKEFLSDLRGWTAAEQVHPDNAVFDRNFHVYAADAHNAFYILTPQVQEKIMAFAGAVGKQTAVTFRGSTLFVAIAGRRSMFDAVIDLPVSAQRTRILEDAALLQKAREILVAAEA